MFQLKNSLLVVCLLALFVSLSFAKTPTGTSKTEAITKFTSKEKLTTFINAHPVVAIGFFESESSKEYEEYKATAEKQTGLASFAVSFSSELATEFQSTAPSVIMLMRHFPGYDAFSGSFTVKELSKFVENNAYPIYGEVNDDNFKNYRKRGLPIAFFVYNNPADQQKYNNFFQEIATTYKGKASFVSMDANTYGSYAENKLHLKKQFPAFAIEKGPFKYPLKGQFSRAAVEKFIPEVLAGKLKWTVKSEPEPKDLIGKTGIYEVVGNTFGRIVLDKSKDVFVHLYAVNHWDCELLDREFAKLIEILSSIESLIFARMNAKKNDVPPTSNYKIEGYPTLKLYKSKTNEIVSYDGERELPLLWKFLKENTEYGAEMTKLEKKHPEVLGEAKVVEETKEERYDEL